MTPFKDPTPFKDHLSVADASGSLNKTGLKSSLTPPARKTKTASNRPHWKQSRWGINQERHTECAYYFRFPLGVLP